MIVLNGKVEQELVNELSQNEIFLNGDRWNELQMRNVSPLIREWRIQEIWLGKNLNSNIIKEIHHIEFTNLKEISLDGNCICSIQGMYRIRMPQLVKVILGHNRVNRIGNIVKADWPKLKDIHVFKNYIQDMHKLPKLKTQILQWITIQYTRDDTEQSSDLRWVLKMQTPQLKALRLKSEKRIREKVMDEILQRKYKDISIKYKA